MIQSCLQCGDLLYQFPAKSSISSMLFEEMGDDLEDISDVEIQIESSSFTEITRSTRENQVWEVQEVQEVQEVVTRTLDEERSCLVPVWITSTGKEKKFQYGLLQQGKRSG